MFGLQMPSGFRVVGCSLGGFGCGCGDWGLGSGLKFSDFGLFCFSTVRLGFQYAAWLPARASAASKHTGETADFLLDTQPRVLSNRDHIRKSSHPVSVSRKGW